MLEIRIFFELNREASKHREYRRRNNNYCERRFNKPTSARERERDIRNYQYDLPSNILEVTELEREGINCVQDPSD